MEVRAIARSVRYSTRKISLVADMVRNLSIDDALAVLEAKHKRAALPLANVLKSAVANAVNNAGLDKNNLVIESINVSGGGANLKRFWPSSRGRTHPFKKRSTNIRIVLKEKVTPSSGVILSEDRHRRPESKDLKVEEKKPEVKKGLFGKLTRRNVREVKANENKKGEK